MPTSTTTLTPTVISPTGKPTKPIAQLHLLSGKSLWLEVQWKRASYAKWRRVRVRLTAPSNAFGSVDFRTLRQEDGCLVGDIIPTRMRSLGWRIGRPLPLGNEGGGVIVDAETRSRHLIGKKVALMGGSTYANYRLASADDCLVLPDDVTAEESAGLHINPFTALGFLDTMRGEGHAALVHTAAASSLGQMLLRLCQREGVPLVNIVRSSRQADLLRKLGAEHIVNSSDEDFFQNLEACISATGATMAFDAIGGGPIGGQILEVMEAAIIKNGSQMDRYGSRTPKRLYTYGALDLSNTDISRSFGFSWSISGWLIFSYLESLAPAELQRMRELVQSNVRTIFRSSYAGKIGLAGFLSPETVHEFRTARTGQKYLLVPSA